MVSIPSTTVTQQSSQSHQTDSTFQLALASTSSTNNFTAIRDGLKTTIAKPTTIQQHQLPSNLNKMPGIVFANTIQLQQSQQLHAKLQQRQSSTTTVATVAQPNTSNTHPTIATRTIQRAHKIQLTQAPPPAIVQQGDKSVQIQLNQIILCVL